MTVQSELMQRLQADEAEMIKIRRQLHAHPELSFHEKETAAYIKKYYQDLDCQVSDSGDSYGLVVDIDSGHPGPKLALRADFDALPIQEDNDLPFKSQNPGVMHACGHDAHTAYLMVLAKNLIALKNQLKGSVRILHQPAEEVAPGGAKSMIAAGCLAGVDNVLGAHVMTSMPTGMIGYHQGPTQTGRSNFTLKLIGKGGHASMPHLTRDAIVAASYFVTTLQTIVSRRIDPFDNASVTIGSFDGRGSFNAIKDVVTLKGDVRVMQSANRPVIQRELRQIISGIETMFGVKAELDYHDDYPVLVNDPAFTEQLVIGLKQADVPAIKTIKDVGPQDPSEDFAYYAEKLPSCFLYVGCQPADGGNYPHHSPLFRLNEASLLIAAEAMGTATLNYLA